MDLEFKCPKCKCIVIWQLIGGQYQYTWVGECPDCGTIWNLDCEEEE